MQTKTGTVREISHSTSLHGQHSDASDGPSFDEGSHKDEGAGKYMLSDGDRAELKHLLGPDSKITPYWIEQLAQIDRPAARNLIPSISPNNALGYEDSKSAGQGKVIKRDSFLGFAVTEKERHKDKVVLVRNGEFYETFGVDALMMIGKLILNAQPRSFALLQNQSVCSDYHCHCHREY
jgi:MutS domain I